MIAQCDQLVAVMFADERPEIFRPEHDGVYCIRGSRHNRDALIERIDNFKKTPSDLLHKPGHVKSRNVRTARSRDDDFAGGIQLVNTSALSG